METTGRLNEALNEVTTHLRAEQLWQHTATELNDRVTTLANTLHTIEVLLGQACAAADERDTTKNLGYTSAAALAANTSPLNLTQTHRIAKLTNRLQRLTHLDQRNQPVIDAYTNNHIPGPHADLIATFLKKNCNRIPDEVHNTIVATLIAFAADSDTQQLKNTITTLTDRFDNNDDTPPPAEDRDLDSLHISRTLNGRVIINGDLNKLCGEMLLTLISALDVQQTGEPGTSNARTPEQLRHDAFEELLRRALAMADLPDDGGQRPNINLTVDWDTLFGTNQEPNPLAHPTNEDDQDNNETGDDENTLFDLPDEADAGTNTENNDDTAETDNEDHTDTDTAAAPCRPQPEDNETGDSDDDNDGNGCCDHNHKAGYSNGDRRGRRGKHNKFTAARDEGILAAIDRMLACAGQLPWGGAIRIELARQIACDADITPILTKNGRPIDMGRTARFATGPLRQYLTLRDRGCAFPGCRRPANWCQAHHIVYYSNGGTTDRHNLILLCAHHHTLIHQSPWEIRMDEHEIPWFIPPASYDPFRQPIPANGRFPDVG